MKWVLYGSRLGYRGWEGVGADLTISMPFYKIKISKKIVMFSTFYLGAKYSGWVGEVQNGLTHTI